MILEMVVDETPLKGIHRLELESPAGGEDPGGDLLGSLDHPEIPGREKTFDIDLHARGAGQLGLQDLVEEMGDLRETPSLVPDEQPSVTRGDMEGAVVRIRCDDNNKAEMPQQGVEGFLSQIERIHRSIE